MKRDWGLSPEGDLRPKVQCIGFDAVSIAQAGSKSSLVGLNASRLLSV